MTVCVEHTSAGYTLVELWLRFFQVVVSAKSRRQLPVKDGSDSGHVLDGAMLGNRVKEKERKHNKVNVWLCTHAQTPMYMYLP